jgi:hypothetical protein
MRIAESILFPGINSQKGMIRIYKSFHAVLHRQSVRLAGFETLSETQRWNRFAGLSAEKLLKEKRLCDGGGSRQGFLSVIFSLVRCLRLGLDGLAVRHQNWTGDEKGE